MGATKAYLVPLSISLVVGTAAAQTSSKPSGELPNIILGTWFEDSGEKVRCSESENSADIYRESGQIKISGGAGDFICTWSSSGVQKTQTGFRFRGLSQCKNFGTGKTTAGPVNVVYENLHQSDLE